MNQFTHHTDNVSACAWFPDSQKFISASLDKFIFILV